MRIIRFADLPVQPWKNGGGTTREIARFEIGGALLWRLSMADVATDGPFSDFTGYHRILTVLSGEGMDLVHPGGSLRADPLAPVQFDGALPIMSRLRCGALQDLNLIYDPKAFAVALKVLTKPGPVRVTAATAGSFALHCAKGSVGLITTGKALNPGDTLIMAELPLDLDIQSGTALLWISLDPLS